MDASELKLCSIVANVEMDKLTGVSFKKFFQRNALSS